MHVYTSINSSFKSFRSVVKGTCINLQDLSIISFTSNHTIRLLHIFSLGTHAIGERVHAPITKQQWELCLCLSSHVYMCVCVRVCVCVCVYVVYNFIHSTWQRVNVFCIDQGPCDLYRSICDSSGFMCDWFTSSSIPNNACICRGTQEDKAKCSATIFCMHIKFLRPSFCDICIKKYCLHA